MIEITASWRETHPGAALGVLTMRDFQTPGKTAQLNRKVKALEDDLRDRYQGIDRSEILKIPEMQAYSTYYKRFRKTYHLLLQIESIAKKNRSIPQGPALIQAMFMSELNSLLLTAGHDLSQIDTPVQLDSSRGDEVYTLLRGNSVTCKSGDMVTRDQQGVFCSVIYGQDLRTRITQNTQNVLYVVYIPPGIKIGMIEQHLEDLENNVKLAFPTARITFRDIFYSNPTSDKNLQSGPEGKNSL
jgi:DNA/RNA-binding domain of Phe-tRNA-synthetase-like protein